MATIINNTYFTNELKLPVDNINVQSFINKHEPIILRKILGYALYKEFSAALASSPAQKWLDLRDGVEYTDSLGYLQKYDGIYLIIADYVFNKIIASLQSEATDSGVKLPLVDNAENYSPRDKMIFANNDMVNRIAVMNDYINRTNEVTQDTYENYLPEVIEKINTFDL